MTTTHKRILLTRMKFIGDVILTTPVIRAVRAANPDAYIAYLGDSNAVSLLEHNPHLNEIIPFDFSRPAVLEQTRVAMLLRRRSFDLAIDLFGNPRSALLTWLSGADVRVGPAKKGRGSLYTIRVTDRPGSKTPVEYHNQYLEAVGIPPATGPTEIVITPGEREEGERLLAGAGCRSDSQRLVLHPGATWPAKKWPAIRFGALARLIHESGLGQVIVLGGPGDREAVETTIRESGLPLPSLVGLPLRQLASVIACCGGFVGNDAGPMHIAVAVGTPTIGIFGPGEENIWFPYDRAPGHRALRKDVPCHPCHLDFCNREGEGYMECMSLLTPEEVLEVLKTSLPSLAKAQRR